MKKPMSKFRKLMTEESAMGHYDVIMKFVDNWRNSMLATRVPVSDPSKWEDEVDAAAEELENELDGLLEEIGTKLHNGEYSRGSGGREFR